MKAASAADVCGVIVVVAAALRTVRRARRRARRPRATTRGEFGARITLYERDPDCTPDHAASRMIARGLRGDGAPRRSNQRSGGTASITRLNDTSSAATLSASSTSITPRRMLVARAEHDREAEHRADHVGAGVAEHEALVQVVAEQPERGAHHRRDRDADGRGADRRSRSARRRPART